MVLLMSDTIFLEASLEAGVERIKELEAQLAEARAEIGELRDDGNDTAAEVILEWWSQANIQGIAQMDGEEANDLADMMRTNPDSAGRE